MNIVLRTGRYIKPISLNYSTNPKGKCLGVLRSFPTSRFPVDTERKFCYDDIYSNIKNRLLAEMYSVTSCEKGELSHAKETDHLHERRASLLPIRL